MSVTNQPASSRRGRGSTPPSRLPSTRERRPALAALAVLLIAGGGVLAGWLALREGQTTQYWVVSSEVQPGDQIERSDLSNDDFPSNSNFVPADDTSPIGQYATSDLAAGEPLMAGDFGPQPEIPENGTVVPLNLAPGQVPFDIANGDYVQVVVAGADSDSHAPENVATGQVMGVQTTDDGTIELNVAMSLQCAGSTGIAAKEEDVVVTKVRPFSTAQCDVGTDPVVPAAPAPANS